MSYIITVHFVYYCMHVDIKSPKPVEDPDDSDDVNPQVDRVIIILAVVVGGGGAIGGATVGIVMYRRRQKRGAYPYNYVHSN